MNLHEYSLNNNIEFGILTELKLIQDKIDTESYDYFQNVINNSQIIYQKVPNYETKLDGLKKKFTGSKIIVDNLSSYFAEKFCIHIALYFCLRSRHLSNGKS